ncbi:hypothetical protein SAMN05421770_11146 [Granulicella rosea]|uniref:Uncharacterized protein n=1 Tax=Granulicella rosea TaxID=474952 RepID=A0A239MCF1_9BACT|nr:DUF6526 family protein [Granulicella rosea]SNT39842.1 hypothetical protein SAMN05421770_11146 [Granulicella rosea]
MSTQSNANHAMWDPMWHFSTLPMSLILVIWSGVSLFRHHDALHAELLLFALTLIMAVAAIRGYGLKNQDRIIRLEEQLRLRRLMPAEPEVVDALNLTQLIGLRFAADAEAPALARRAVKENLDRKAIKAAVVVWRPDNHRV